MQGPESSSACRFVNSRAGGEVEDEDGVVDEELEDQRLLEEARRKRKRSKSRSNKQQQQQQQRGNKTRRFSLRRVIVRLMGSRGGGR